MGSFKIGQLADAAQVGRDTIRYYERSGLLPMPGRTAAGYRVYGDADLQRLNFIRASQELGFTLEQVRHLLAIKASDTATAAAVLEITFGKIQEAESRVQKLSHIRNVLQELADDCPGEGPVSDCPILAYLAEKRVNRATKR
ncbi:heavy metal-responsive transcriptional regulator [Tardiphaga sp.]|uniref:heavy metal-responsive transcriptional regulator n=1 Tax=Tardiphaga sp. TaxID=1926292 RepID=UPI00352B0393